MNLRGLAAAMLAAGLLATVGCPKPPCPGTHVPLDVVVREYNANADKAPRLWARARIHVALPNGWTWGSSSLLARGNGYVMLTKNDAGPPDFVLIGEEPGCEVFRAGIDSREGLYYFWYRAGQKSEAAFGRVEFAGAPGVRAMPVDPVQLAEILGVTPLPPLAADSLPAVVMTIQQDPPAYVLRYLKRQPVTGRLKIWREVYYRWSDKPDVPRLPFQVRLYDSEGFCRVIADVAQYRKIRTDEPESAWPVMPTDIRLDWPEITNVQPHSAMEITLTEMTTLNPFKRSLYDAWSHLPPGASVRQVDAGCERAGTTTERAKP